MPCGAIIFTMQVLHWVTFNGRYAGPNNGDKKYYIIEILWEKNELNE